MVEIKNVKVYELKECIHACRNAKRLSYEELKYSFREPVISEEDIVRAIKLSKSPVNSGHANFLKGIRVSFDIIYPNYFSPELQRYNFLDIITSSSKMHTLLNLDLNKSCNKYVGQRQIKEIENYINNYNNIENNNENVKGYIINLRDDSFVANSKKEALYYTWMQILSNCPMGLELFMRVSTNYMQLRNIYHQRKAHKLKEDWGAFCEMIENLPYFEEFINTKK